MSAKAILATLPYKIKRDNENEVYKNYVARNLRIIGENTARMSQGGYMKVDYEDIINPKPQKQYKIGEATSKIRDKLR